MTRNNKIKVALCWQTTATDNLGVAALAQANIYLLKEAASEEQVELEFIEFCPQASGNYQKDEYLSIADPISIKRILLGKSKYIKQLRSCDLVVDIGQGDSFSDIYGMKRFNYLVFSKILCGLFNLPLILAPQTIGPFASNTASWLASLCFKSSKYIFPRDDLSYQYALEICRTDKVIKSSDVAFYLPYEKQSYDISNTKKRLGINVSGLLYNGGYNRENQFSLTLDYRSLIEGILKRLSVDECYEVHLIGHVNSDTYEVEDDYRVIQMLGEQYPNTIVAPKFKTASEAKSYISSMDFFSGARMHSCIAAFSSGVPVLPMAYSRKFNGLFGSLNYNNLLDLKNTKLSDAESLFFSSLENLETLKRQVELGNELAFTRLANYKSMLVSTFKGLKDNL